MQNYILVIKVYLLQHPSETPPPTRVETREERIERKRRERAEQTAYKLEQEIALWDPTDSPKVTTDPFKTLFVARVVSEFKINKKKILCYIQILVAHFIDFYFQYYIFLHSLTI